jgi:hypothetical protein
VANLESDEFMRSRQPQVEAYVRAVHRQDREAANQGRVSSCPVQEERR